MATKEHEIVFLFDVDNTLLDNDRVTADLRKHLEKTVGKDDQLRYFEIFEQLRNELGYADYLGALQRFRVENPHTQNLLEVSHFLLNYPFANRLYPGSLDAGLRGDGRLRAGETLFMSWCGINEPSIADTIEILKGLKSRFENHHGVKYSSAAITSAAELSARFINDRHLPDKAIDVIDEAGAAQRLGQRQPSRKQ